MKKGVMHHPFISTTPSVDRLTPESTIVEIYRFVSIHADSSATKNGTKIIDIG